MQKFPERRKLIKKLTADGSVEGLNLESLRSDIVMLGQRLTEARNLLMALGYNAQGKRTTTTYLEAIRKFYEFEKGLSEVDSYTVINKKSVDYLLQTLQQYLDEGFKQRPELVKTTIECEKTKNEIETIKANGKIPEPKKAQLVLEKGAKLERLKKEFAQYHDKIIPLIEPLIEKINKNIALTKTERANLKRLLNEERYKEFILTYFKGLSFNSFGLFDEVLSIGQEENFKTRTPEIEMQYLYLAKMEKEKIFEFLLPDKLLRESILAKIKLDKYHLNRVNDESTYYNQRLMKYIQNQDFLYQLNTLIIDFALYLINSGVQYNMKMRNMMEHFDASHKSFHFASSLEVFKELISCLTDIEQRIVDRELELQAKSIAPVIQDIDEAYVFNSTQTFAAIAIALKENSGKFNCFKKHVTKSQQLYGNILPIGGDGNCIYNSIIAGFSRLPVLPDNINIDIRNINLAQLRNIIADHIRDNQGHYFDLIAYQIADNIRHNELAGYPAAIRARMQALATDYRFNIQATELAIQQFINGGVVGQYMNLMRNANPSHGNIVWGGGVELGIISKLFGIQFYVYRRGGEYYHIDQTNQPDAPRIDLDYTGNHYNLVLLPTMLRAPVDCAQNTVTISRQSTRSSQIEFLLNSVMRNLRSSNYDIWNFMTRNQKQVEIPYQDQILSIPTRYLSTVLNQSFNIQVEGSKIQHNNGSTTFIRDRITKTVHWRELLEATMRQALIDKNCQLLSM